MFYQKEIWFVKIICRCLGFCCFGVRKFLFIWQKFYQGEEGGRVSFQRGEMGCYLVFRFVKFVFFIEFEFCILFFLFFGGTIGRWFGWSGFFRQDLYGCIFEIIFQMIIFILFGKFVYGSNQEDGRGGGDRRDDVLRIVEFLYVVNSFLLLRRIFWRYYDLVQLFFSFCWVFLKRKKKFLQEFLIFIIC